MTTTVPSPQPSTLFSSPPGLTFSTVPVIIRHTTCFFIEQWGQGTFRLLLDPQSLPYNRHSVYVYLCNEYGNKWMNAIISELIYECMNGFFHMFQSFMGSASVFLISVPANIVKATVAVYWLSYIKSHPNKVRKKKAIPVVFQLKIQWITFYIKKEKWVVSVLTMSRNLNPNIGGAGQVFRPGISWL